MLLEKYVSRKLIVAVGTIIALIVVGQYEAAAGLAGAYVLGQGAVDALDSYSNNKGAAQVQSAAIEARGPIDPK